MRIFLLYLFSGALFFFQLYYSQFIFSPDSIYGIRTFAVISSVLLFLSGFLLLFKIILGIYLSFFSSSILIYHLIEVFLGSKDLLKINFTLPLMLLIFINIHSILYILNPNWIRRNSKFYNTYFPRVIERRVALIVSTAAILVTFGLISIVILFIDVRKKVERYATWNIEENNFFHTKKIVFEFKEYPGYIIEFTSEKLYEKLISEKKSSIPIEIEFSLDFGNVKGYKILSLDGDKVEKYGFYLFSNRCLTINNNCSMIPLWEEK